MSKETLYAEQLRSLGIYDPAFDGAIHILCIQERELSRAMKAWKATAPSPKDAPSITDPIYAEIAKLRRDILARQDALGLQRLRKQMVPASDSAPPPAAGNQALTQLLDSIRGKHSASTP